MLDALLNLLRRFGVGGPPCCELNVVSDEGKGLILLRLRDLQACRDHGLREPSFRDLSSGFSAEVFVEMFLQNLRKEILGASAVPARHRRAVLLRILIRNLVSMTHLSSSRFVGHESALESALKRGEGVPFLDWRQFEAVRDYLRSIGAADGVAYSVEVAGDIVSAATAAEVAERLRRSPSGWRISHPAWGGGVLFRVGSPSSEILSSGFFVDDSGIGIWPLGVLPLVKAIEAPV